MIKFVWDPVKAVSNQKKHGVSFEESQSIFYDDFAIQFFDDEESSVSEDRFLMLGMSSESRVLMVCHCEQDSDQTIRIISARKATNTECKSYQGPKL